MDRDSERAYAERPSAGQESERIPDFIPGWFAPRFGNLRTWMA